jgi:3-hydroxyisobutyrate dehydrogenase-like beta-hydroxyacid dehydrogenase
MGTGMVSNLLRAGHSVAVWTRRGVDGDDLVAAGARVAESIADAARDAEFVMYCLSDDDAVRAVVLAGDGLAAAVGPGVVVIDLSTISPAASAEARAAVEARGAAFLDAPVFGSKGEAASGGLWVVVGGEPDVLDSAREVLEPVSETIHHLGAAGSGVRMKLVGNLVVASQLLALGEALTLAKKSGLDLQAVLDVLAVTDFRSPIFDGVGPSVLADDYSPSFALGLMAKDAGLIRDLARDVEAPVTVVDAAATYIEDAVASGWAKENASALIKAIAASARADLSA